MKLCFGSVPNEVVDRFGDLLEANLREDDVIFSISSPQDLYSYISIYT
jgi:hypothetical protein